MTNYNERLDDVLKNVDTVGQQFGMTPDELKQAITSLYKELVAEAMPEPGTNLTSYEAQMFIISTEEYRQNLLKALSDNGKAG